MNVLFVRPRYDSGFGMKPLGIAVLSAIAKHVGFTTDLFDTGYLEHEFTKYDYLEKLQSFTFKSRMTVLSIKRFSNASRASASMGIFLWVEKHEAIRKFNSTKRTDG